MTTNEIIDSKGQNDFSTDRRIPLARLFANGGWLRRELGRSGLGPLLHESRSGFEPVFFRLESTEIDPVDLRDRVVLCIAGPRNHEIKGFGITVPEPLVFLFVFCP